MIKFTEFLTEVFDNPKEPADISDYTSYKAYERVVTFYVDDVLFRIDLRFTEPFSAKTNFNRISVNFYAKDSQGFEYDNSNSATSIKQAYRVLATVKHEFIKFVQDMFKKFKINEATIVAVASSYSRERVYTKMFTNISVPGFTIKSTPNRSHWIVSKND